MLGWSDLSKTQAWKERENFCSEFFLFMITISADQLSSFAEGLTHNAGKHSGGQVGKWEYGDVNN